GIGSLPATLRDRSVLIPLVPAEEGQIANRFDPLRTEIEQTLARKLARWAADNFNALAACNPPLPPGAFNRLADNWRPLLAIAQIAGADWPARALNAFKCLSLPLLGGQWIAKSSSPVGQRNRGGLGKPLGRGEGGLVSPTGSFRRGRRPGAEGELHLPVASHSGSNLSSAFLDAEHSTLNARRSPQLLPSIRQI